MAVQPRISRAAANAAADALLRLLAGGYLRLYGGVQPADPDVAIGPQTLLAELKFSAPAFMPAHDGLASQAAPITGTAKANGCVTWCRAYAADGKTPIWDGSVGVSDANVTLDTVSIMEGAVITLTGLSYTQART